MWLSKLTHVELPDKAGHVIVFVVEGQELPAKLRLVVDDEAVAILQHRAGRVYTKS
jgi:hypothetical protein